MAMGISGISNSSTNIVSAMTTDKTKSQSEKPTWDGKKAYKYIEDCNEAGLEYGAKATKYYTSKTTEDGEMSVEDLKKQIKEWFQEYTLTGSEPKDVVKGKHYLYIDDSQLKKMASDATYRAKIYGLMDREYATGKEYTMTYSDGVNKTMHITGSIFSLSEANKKYAGGDGIPYHGSCTSDAGFSSTQSHLQVRSQSFLTDNLNPVKSARKSRTVAAKKQAEEFAEKRIEKKKAAAKEEKKKHAEKIEEKREEKRAEATKEMENRLSSDNHELDSYYAESDSGKTVGRSEALGHFDAKV